MVKDFEEEPVEQPSRIMLGEEPPQDMAQQIQNLYQIIMKDPTAAEYLQAQMRFSMMMSDVYKLLADAMGLGN